LDTFCEAAMKACVLQARSRNLEVDAELVIGPLRVQTAEQYNNLLADVKHAAAAGGVSVERALEMLPGDMLRDLTNSRANVAGVQALIAAGYIPAEGGQ
jgi:hypothetical protein